MSITKLKKITFKKFRSLENVSLELGDRITLICGKNGTSKSSILGVAAQIFSFDKDYIKNEKLSYKQITGTSFKSQFSEHFRISNEYDLPGSIDINFELYDGYTNKDQTGELTLSQRGEASRPVVRNNSSVIDGNKSRNYTHPVIFLSLKRLYPIAQRAKYTTKSFEYLRENERDFINYTNELLNRNSSRAVGTDGIVRSAVAYGDNYDHESVSAGEDNAGQIILALMSFKKLKDEYSDYKGGLLLIDEADAGLFPTAQKNLIKIFERECKKLNIQVIMSSHSPTIIEDVYEKSQTEQRYAKNNRKNFKTIYLTDSHAEKGKVEIEEDWSWMQIAADLHSEVLKGESSPSFPKVDVFLEDGEARDFLRALLKNHPIKKYLKINDVSLGASNYIELVGKNIKYFSTQSIICLDADQKGQLNKKKYKTILSLPGKLPPDQLIFEYLHNLTADHLFWKNNIQYTRSTFTNNARDIISMLDVQGESINLLDIINQKRNTENDKDNPRIRDLFKKFYRALDKKIIDKVWKDWIDNNSEECKKFSLNFEKMFDNVMKSGYSISPEKMFELRTKLKKDL
jgi:AAA15 family ATPase/GTPase